MPRATGDVARELGISREQLLADLDLLGLHPARNTRGQRQLSDKEISMLRWLRKEKARRRAPYRR